MTNLWTRRRLLKALAGVTGVGLGGGYYALQVEPDLLEVTHREISADGLQGPVRILHLADLHIGTANDLRRAERAFTLGMEQVPDLCLLTGDFVLWGGGDREAIGRLLRHVAQQLPTFASLGNHDAKAVAPPRSNPVAEMLASSVSLLINRAVPVDVRDQRLMLIGLGDLWLGDMQPEGLFTAPDKQRLPTLVLAHNPDTKDHLENMSWDILFAGHTHGGQVVLPLGVRPFLPVIDRSMVAGLYHWKNRYIHITRGVGNLHGLRFNCRPEVSLITLHGRMIGS